MICNCNKNPYLCLKLLSYKLIPNFIKNNLFYQLGMYSKIQNSNSIFLNLIKEIYTNGNIETIKDNFFKLNLKEQKELLKIITIINPYLALKYYEKFNINDELKKALILNLFPEKPENKKIQFKNENIKFNLYNFYLKKSNNDNFKFLYRDKVNDFLKNELNVKKRNKNKPLYVNNIQELNDSNYKFNSNENITIIMTVFNEEKLIKYSLTSLINQTYQNLKIILVDDGSIDKTLDVSRETFKKYNFTNYMIIKNIKNYGTYISRNIALKYVLTDYIGFQDADDFSFSKRIEEQISLMNKEKKSISFCNLLRIKENGELFSKNIYPLNRMAHISMIMTKDVFYKIGYFRIENIGNDSEYFERAKTFIEKNISTKISKILLLAAQRKNSLTTNKKTGVEEFGINSLRINLWEKWREEHLKNINNRNYYIDFNEKDYEYEILYNQ